MTMIFHMDYSEIKEGIEEDDIKFAIKTEKAYQEIKKGKCKTLPLEEFLKELKRW